MTGNREEDGEAGIPAVSDAEKLQDVIAPITSIEIDRMRSTLARIVEKEVVPRLIVADRSVLSREIGSVPTASQASAEEVNLFQFMVVHDSTSQCMDFVARLRARGVSLRSIYMGLFAPVAEELGRKWSREELTFLDVTIGMSRLQSMVYPLSDAENALRPLREAHDILLGSAIEEQHSLGMLIISETFRSEGWNVSGGLGQQVGSGLIDQVHDRWFGVVGLSASQPEHALALKAEIDRIRNESLNPGISILVGGRGFIQYPELAREIGADGFAGNADEAVVVAEELLKRSE